MLFAYLLLHVGHIPQSGTEEACPICYAKYQHADDNGSFELAVRVQCPGGHSFGHKCLQLALKDKLTCPMCRHDLSEYMIPDWTSDDWAIIDSSHIPLCRTVSGPAPTTPGTFVFMEKEQLAALLNCYQRHPERNPRNRSGRPPNRARWHQNLYEVFLAYETSDETESEDSSWRDREFPRDFPRYPYLPGRWVQSRAGNNHEH